MDGLVPVQVSVLAQDEDRSGMACVLDDVARCRWESSDGAYGLQVLLIDGAAVGQGLIGVG
jgi:hypothetical protein